MAAGAPLDHRRWPAPGGGVLQLLVGASARVELELITGQADGDRRRAALIAAGGQH